MRGNMGLPWVNRSLNVSDHAMPRDANDRWGERGAWIGTQLGCTVGMKTFGGGSSPGWPGWSLPLTGQLNKTKLAKS